MNGRLLSAIEVTRRTASQLRAVAYLRVSTEEQKKGFGIRYTGKKVCRHIAKKDWRLVETFADEGFSGSLEWHERPDLKRLMELARTTPRPFDVVVVLEERAIGRAGRAFWPWVWELEDLGVFTAIVRGDYDNTTDEGRKRMRDEAARAEDERIAIRDRTQGGIQEAAEQRADEAGYVGGQCPYGWRIENQGRKGECTYVLDDGPDGEWHTLDMARRLVIEHKGDIERAAGSLNAQGKLTRWGKLWTRQNLQARLLSAAVLESRVVFRATESAANRVQTDADGNPVYGETVVIRIPSAFSEVEVAELKGAVKVRNYGPKRGDRTCPLSERILSTCGEYYTGCAPGERARKYRCAGKRPKYAGAPVCTCRQIPADEIEFYAWGRLVRLLRDPEELKLRAELWVGLNDQAKVNFVQRLKELEGEIAQKDRAIGVIMAAAAQESDNPEEAIRAATASLKEQRTALAEERARVAAWQAESAAVEDQAQQLQQLAKLAAKRLTNVTLDDQALVLGMMNARLVLLEPVGNFARSCPVTTWFREAGRPIPVLTDDTWAVVEPVIRARHRPDKRLPQRQALEGLLHKARHEGSWHTLTDYGNPGAMRSAWDRWRTSGAWSEAIGLLGTAGAQPVPSRLPRMRLKFEVIPGLILNAGSDSITRDPRAR
ncbi:DNA recombinase [Streptomyces cadmiisoli]|uniref:DNA recombinase n=1 Tax=Streptomyces cadmiisoli TaxID=2184053 RepID=A0A2Z4J7C3_9ACTN|nr:DNA recombinase [Streptomyces cadmiisoli]